jgi:hypothetical protein
MDGNRLSERPGLFNCLVVPTAFRFNPNRCACRHAGQPDGPEAPYRPLCRDEAQWADNTCICKYSPSEPGATRMQKGGRNTRTCCTWGGLRRDGRLCRSYSFLCHNRNNRQFRSPSGHGDVLDGSKPTRPFFIFNDGCHSARLVDRSSRGLLGSLFWSKTLAMAPKNSHNQGHPARWGTRADHSTILRSRLPAQHADTRHSKIVCFPTRVLWCVVRRVFVARSKARLALRIVVPGIVRRDPAMIGEASPSPRNSLTHEVVAWACRLMESETTQLAPHRAMLIALPDQLE